MYLRTKTTPTRKTVQLVESRRDAEGRPRQRILLSLGSVDIPEVIRAAVARGIEDRLSGQLYFTPELIDPVVARWVDTIVRRLDVRRMPVVATSAAIAPIVLASAPMVVESQNGVSKTTTGSCDPCVSEISGPIIDGVVAAQVSHQNTVILGPVLVGLRAWESLEMPSLLERLGLNTQQRMAITIDVINRLVEPVSENALPAWVVTTALPELLGVTHIPGGRDGYYRACDLAWQQRAVISAHLRHREQQHFSLERTILLYDLTNTYFEGNLLGNPQAKRGHSKEKRNDCPQVVVGMVFDQHGFELGHEVFAGNQSDPKSLVDMAVHLRAAVDADRPLLQQMDRPLVIVDGGIATAANRQMFTDMGFDYLANDSRSGRKKYAAYFQEDTDFTAIPERDGTAAILVRCLPDPLAPSGVEPDTLILCKSAGRREKEHAIFSSAEKRFLDDIQRLNTTIAKGRRIKRDRIEHDIVRLLARHPRVARYYHTCITETAEHKTIICATRKTDVYDQADGLLGCYVLRTCSHLCQGAQNWWSLYMTLSRAEDGFRVLKGDLGLRPIRHHGEARAKAHIFISVLAYHLLHFITHSLALTGDHRQWTTIRRVLSTHAYTTILLPTTDDIVHRIRKPGTPDLAQQQIYHALNIDWSLLPSSHTTA